MIKLSARNYEPLKKMWGIKTPQGTNAGLEKKIYEQVFFVYSN